MARPELDPTTEGHVAVDCYVRADAISDPIEENVESILALERDGHVDECVVRTWPGEVVVTPLTDDSLVVDRFRTFEQWAAQWGVHVDPPFRRETRTSEYTGETREVLRTPALCMAVYVDGRLREVFPHRSKGTTFTVADAVETLEAGIRSADATTADPPTRRGNCPECDVPLTTGQGLYACPDCGWVAVATGDGRFRQYDVDGTSDATRDDAEQSLIRP